MFASIYFPVNVLFLEGLQFYKKGCNYAPRRSPDLFYSILKAPRPVVQSPNQREKRDGLFSSSCPCIFFFKNIFMAVAAFDLSNQ
jgi:hypothetical protein